MIEAHHIKLGIDLGSTTAKVVALDADNKIIYKSYRRHFTRIVETISEILEDLKLEIGDVPLNVCMTGSAAMGITERLGIQFVQEVIAVTKSLQTFYPEARTLIDIGGEDAKLVLLEKGKSPDIRMNGVCAGGTGAFIDQMASLLNISIGEMDKLAKESSTIYPIASRCGVFAKTDVQNLIARKISLADISASIFHAVALQTVNALARGYDMTPQVVFCGGPLTYISSLRKAFVNLLKLQDSSTGSATSDYAIPENAELFTALGTALSANDENKSLTPLLLITDLAEYAANIVKQEEHLSPLFSSEDPYIKWIDKRRIIEIPKKEPAQEQEAFIGIDSGSTTTKIVITDKEDNLLYSFYANNQGNPLKTAIDGLSAFYDELKEKKSTLKVLGSAVTGYGEDLLKAALNMDYGIVETIAHYLAARKIDPEVSFILDIGGQDIKAIFAQNGTITDIEINEACSSGCGSFIEGFAKNLGFTPQKFAQLACDSTAPCDLGSRCTVFMNSKVRQAIKDGATVEDLSAGLAYSVVKNCLYKVLNLEHLKEIGNNIVVQGGTFKNKAVFRALELLSEKQISASDKPELMGAYGAALFAKSKQPEKSSFIGLDKLAVANEYKTKFSYCKACTNNCQITVFQFPNGKKCYSGNKCEKVFSNNLEAQSRGENVYEYKRESLFSKHAPVRNKNINSTLKLGIPRILTMYESYPFWQSLFANAGIETVLSGESTTKLYEKGAGSIMADNICFPAKLAHGHIVDLGEKSVNRIFYPFILFEKKEFEGSHNCYNCPILTAYSEVLSNIKTGVPLDAPAFNFNDEKLLEKACTTYLQTLGVDKETAQKAFTQALKTQDGYKKSIIKKNKTIFENAKKSNTPVILLAGHPYHTDPLVHQKISDILSDLGVAVINEEISLEEHTNPFRKEYFTISQWAYQNRILQATAWAAEQKTPVYVVQMNSFGCGPDAIIVDEVKDLLKRKNKSYTLIRIDEIASTGSIKLRLRSLVESIKLKDNTTGEGKPFESTRPFTVADKKKTILAPWFGDFYSPYIPALFGLMGYELINLPKPNRETLNEGLRVMNNEICYPALLVVGDLISAVKSGNYNLDEIVVAVTQTGGQCRATNYISMIKRALINAGYKDIPVLAVGTGGGTINEQPGFDFDYKKIIFPVLHVLFFSDALSRLYYATVSRELHKGDSEGLKEKYLKLSTQYIVDGKHKQLKQLLQQAVEEFNAVACTDKEIKVIGIIGEIYVKYNSFGNYGIVNWLLEQGIEVAVPPITNFFMQGFVNSEVMQKQFINNKSRWNLIRRFAENYINRYKDKYERVMKNFVRYRPVENVREEAHLASQTVNLLNQYGEGWLIPGEIAGYAKQGITDIICIQPFGCIANHVVGKGIEKRIRAAHPDLNLLYLDFDYGTSPVNVHNRLHFMLMGKE
ncbi:MAG: acyl-CoA dehydratase activase [Prevotellaceae bacterium]|jgi:predicted CoA-substrate-specific enzyme activase|nr:acyl-CoA dehydratase activase [Prevotellaceae bacterium]